MGDLPKMHVSLNVRDIERSVAFYEAFFGVPAHKRRPGYANFALSEPPLKLALQEGAAVDGGGRLSHLGIQFATEADVDAARARLAESGVVTFEEGDTVCCYARQDKVWVHDPDGNAWEVYVLLDEMEDQEDDHFATGGMKAGESACCSEDAPPRTTGGVPLSMATGEARGRAARLTEVAPTPAIACNLDAFTLKQEEQHRTLVEGLRAHVQAIREAESGWAFELPSDAAVCQQAMEFATLERLCCPFLTFRLELAPAGGPLTLTLTGPEGTKEILAGFLRTGPEK